MNKLALVTGGNRGIGYELCRQLAEREVTVVLTGRDMTKVNDAVSKLADEGFEVIGMMLDLGSKNSINEFESQFSKLERQLDLLFHNAALLTPADRKGPLSQVPIEIIEETLQVNFLGPLYLTQLLLPHLGSGSRIINISARPALFRNLTPQMPAYRLSKLALNGMSVILQQELGDRGIIVASMHPGWVRTDMGGSNAPRSVDEGVDTALWLALDAGSDIGGKFYMDRKELEW